MKFLYKYPQKRFPYEQLIEENQRRDRNVSEYEILDTDVFDEDRYWDVFVEVRSVLKSTYSYPPANFTSFAVCEGRTRSRQSLHSNYVIQPWP